MCPKENPILFFLAHMAIAGRRIFYSALQQQKQDQTRQWCILSIPFSPIVLLRIERIQRAQANSFEDEARAYSDDEGTYEEPSIRCSSMTVYSKRRRARFSSFVQSEATRRRRLLASKGMFIPHLLGSAFSAGNNSVCAKARFFATLLSSVLGT